MSQYLNIYFEDKAEGILSHAVISHSSNYNFRSTRQWWFLLSDLQQISMPSKGTVTERSDRKA